jgi:hypothetical protein
MEHMRVKHFIEDIDATSVMPQLDIRILSASLERVEHADATVEPAAAPSAPAETPEWKVADRLAELQDQVANLQAALRESENRYSRLTTRHETLLQKFEAYELAQASKQHELAQTQEKLATTEQSTWWRIRFSSAGNANNSFSNRPTRSSVCARCCRKDGLSTSLRSFRT